MAASGRGRDERDRRRPSRSPARSTASSRSFRGSSRIPARRRSRSRPGSGSAAEQLDDDLALVLMIGVPPYSPGDYLDVVDDGEVVTIRLADYFSRPLRLTPAEGLALLAAGRALLAVPGRRSDGPLATALAKLDGRARPPGGSRSRSGSRRTCRRSADAAADGRARRDRLLVGRTRRDDDPAHRPGARVLRDGRVVRRRVLPSSRRRAHVPRSTASARSARPASTSSRRHGRRRRRRPRTVFRPGPTIPGSRCGSRPSRGVGRREPSRRSRPPLRPDGTLEVVLAVSEPAWLERLLVRLGPEATVVAPPEPPGRPRRRRPDPGPVRHDVSARPAPRPIPHDAICEDGVVEQPR